MKTALITGGSDGIGLELAEYFVRDYEVILAARNIDKLTYATERIYRNTGRHVETIAVDLSFPHEAERLYQRLAEREIAVLVNNAGMGYTGKCTMQSVESCESMVELNISSLLVLTRLFGKKMAQHHNGIILNVSSTGAFQPGPYIAEYYASKSFVLSYTKAVHEELKKENVQVYCLCPGPVKTKFYEKYGGKAPWYAMSPEKCAQYAYAHLHQKGCVMIPGVGNKLLTILPQSFRMKAVGFMKKKGLEER